MFKVSSSPDKTFQVSSGHDRQAGQRWFAPVVLAVVLGTGSLGLGGCNQLAKVGVGTTPINKVVNNPTKYPNVVVRGKVVNQIGILGRGAYEIKDKTGSMWVFTQAGIPQIDSTVTVRGSAAEGVTFSGSTLGVTITEKERL